MLLFPVNYTAAVFMSRMRSPMYEGMEVRDEYRELTEALSRGPKLCVQTTERFINRFPALASGLFGFTQALSLMLILPLHAPHTQGSL